MTIFKKIEEIINLNSRIQNSSPKFYIYSNKRLYFSTENEKNITVNFLQKPKSAPQFDKRSSALISCTDRNSYRFNLFFKQAFKLKQILFHIIKY